MGASWGSSSWQLALGSGLSRHSSLAFSLSEHEACPRHRRPPCFPCLASRRPQASGLSFCPSSPPSWAGSLAPHPALGTSQAQY